MAIENVGNQMLRYVDDSQVGAQQPQRPMQIPNTPPVSTAPDQSQGSSAEQAAIQELAAVMQADRDKYKNEEQRIIDELAGTLSKSPEELTSEELAKTMTNPVDTNMLQDFAGGVVSSILTNTSVANANTLRSSLGTTEDRLRYTKDGEFTVPYFQNNWDAIGVSKEEWEDMDSGKRAQLLKKSTRDNLIEATGANPESGSFLAGEILGMIFGDPITYVPILGQTAKARALYGATVAGADTALYTSVEEGEVNIPWTLGGIGLGATIGAATKGFGIGSKLGSSDPKVKQSAALKMSEVSKAIKAKLDSKTMPHVEALTKTMKEFNLSYDDLRKLEADAGHTVTQHWARKRDVSAVDRWFEPVSERIRRYAPKIHNNMNKMFMKINSEHLAYERLTHDFITGTFEEAGRLGFGKAFKKALLVGDEKAFYKMLKQMPNKHTKHFDAYKKAMDDLYDLSAQARVGTKAALGKKIDLYMHRAIKDRDVIRNIISKEADGHEQLSRLDKIVKEEAAKANQTLNDEQLNSIYSKFLNGYYDLKGSKIVPSATRERKLHAAMFEKHPELVDAFHDPVATTHTYIRQTLEDTYKKSFFGKKVVDKYGDEINKDMLGEVVRKEVTDGNLTTQQVDELKDALELVFVTGTRSPGKYTQMFKDVTYAGLLGNPVSALTQIGDIFIASAKYGFTNTMAAVIKSLGGRGFSPKEMGLMESMMEEFVSTGPTKTLLRKALKYGQFQRVDALGKAVNMNAAFRSAIKDTKTSKGLLRLEAKWGKAFGDDFVNLVDDLANKRVTDRTKTLVFSELADVQPITLMEMPEKYLSMQNGRVIYMLRTFQLKFLNLLRKNMIDRFQEGHRMAAIKSGMLLYSMFALGGASTDVTKDFFLGRDSYPEDILVNNLIKPTGFMDRYSGQKFLSAADPISVVVNNLVPPYSFYSPIVATPMKIARDGADDMAYNKMVKMIPVFGKLMENYLLGGMEEYNTKRWKEHAQ